MKEFTGWILGGILVLAVLTGVGFYSGKMQAIYNRTIGVEVSSSQTDMFHKSKGFTDGMAQDLSKYKLELTQEKDEVARKAIINHINEEFANFDETTIQNTGLRQFLIDVRNGKIN